MKIHSAHNLEHQPRSWVKGHHVKAWKADTASENLAGAFLIPEAERTHLFIKSTKPQLNVLHPDTCIWGAGPVNSRESNTKVSVFMLLFRNLMFPIMLSSLLEMPSLRSQDSSNVLLWLQVPSCSLTLASAWKRSILPQLLSWTCK